MGETLSHLYPDELTYKFDLEGLIYDRTFNSYSKVRQMAFFVKYKGKHVTISNTNINDYPSAIKFPITIFDYYANGH